jgi:uncharacterized membrane protein (UPF0136 family)
MWVALASLVVMITWIWGVPSSQDLSNHFRFALPFYDSLHAGHWYPGWLAESNSGYGDPSFRFYPPALYYLMAALRTITGNWYAATAVTATMLSALGGLGVYFWTREIRSAQVAMWAGIGYTLAPYHLNQLFQSFMLAEFAGAAVLPFAFAFTERVCRERKPRDVAGLAAAYAILVLTHLPLAVIGSIALLVYAILRLRAEKRLVTLGWLTLSVGMGLAASASYWLTMLFELNWIRADNINPDPSVDYRANFIFSTWSSSNVNVWWMNIVLLVSVAMFWPALILLRRSARESIGNDHARSNALAAMGAVALLAIIMATPISLPIWKLLRPLQQTQFPWRWLSIASMICPILLAASIPYWKKIAEGRKRPLAFLAVGTAVLALTFSASHIIREAFWLTPHEFEATLNRIPGSQSVSQWWPAWVHEPLRKMSSPVEVSDRKVAVESWEPERRVFHVGPGPAGEARIRTFYYPHWTATSDGQSLAVRPDQDGAMLISLPQNAETVSLEFREPKRVRYGAALTMFGWISIGLLALKRRYVRKT